MIRLGRIPRTVTNPFRAHASIETARPRSGPHFSTTTTMSERKISHIIISGPSGAGKSTIKDRLLTTYPDIFGFSVSHTTRSPRERSAGVMEEDGVDYYFTTPDEFEALLARDGFIEHAKFGDKYYGTSRATVQDVLQRKEVCVLDIEMEGVKQIRKDAAFSSNTRFLFLQPPSVAVLEQRLRGRGNTKEADIQKRLAQADREIAYSTTPGVHDKIIVNDERERTWAEVLEWIRQETGAKV